MTDERKIMLVDRRAEPVPFYVVEETKLNGVELSSGDRRG